MEKLERLTSWLARKRQELVRLRQARRQPMRQQRVRVRQVREPERVREQPRELVQVQALLPSYHKQPGQQRR